MTPRRQQTVNKNNDQPVRLYKSIALTFLILTVLLLGVIVLMSSKRAEIVIQTKPEPLSSTFVLELQNGNGEIDSVITTTTERIEYEFSPQGVSEEEAVATGKVILKNDGSVDQPLVKTTRLLTPEGVLFRLKESVVVPAGGTLEAEVYADQKGKSGNIGPSTFTIPGLKGLRQKLVYASSVGSMQGGSLQVGVFSPEDLEKAKKNFEEMAIEKIKNEFSKIYPDQKVLVAILENKATTDKEIGNRSEKITLVGDVRALVVAYYEDQLRTLVHKKLAQKITDDYGQLIFSKESPQVKYEEYFSDKNLVRLSITGSGIVNLNPESRQLEKYNFYGKTKEEVNRYLMSVDYVQDVQVKILPSWVKTIPFMGDHLTIKLKSTE